jgi:nucleoside-diphosphate-sugar epimerase
MKKPITINGDPEERLDFTYIDDLIQGVKLIIEKESSKNQTFNLTFGESRSINDLTLILKDNFNDLKIEFGEREPFTPKRGTLDITKAKNLLGFEPLNPIEIAYPKYINWYKGIWKKFN